MNETKMMIYNRYFLYENGKIYDTETNMYLKVNKKYQYLLFVNGNKKKISLKVVYRNTFNKEFCIDNIKDLDGEIWKQLEYDNRYYISNKGRVKSYCGYYSKLLKPQLKENGYLEVMINGKHKYIHRLVAETFLENKYNFDTVDHLDFIKTNNDVSNLRYLSRSDNAKRRRNIK